MSQREMNLSVDLAPANRHQLKLPNPVMIASGTFGYDGYGRGIPPEMDLGQLGAVIPKTVTRLPRQGNPEPRWYPESFRVGRETGECIFLNSIGLANPGIETALDQLAPQWAQLATTVFLSLSAESVVQFGEMTAMTRGVAGFQALELNLSCPNIENGAMFGHSAELTAAVVDAVRTNTDLPVLVKLAPNVPDVADIALAAVEAVAGCADHLQHNPGDENRRGDPQAGPGSEYRRSFRSRSETGGRCHGLPRRPGGGRADNRGGRHLQCP